MTHPNIGSAKFRSVLGNFPTGVTVITAQGDDGPIGMTIGAFTSISLDPPLVGFLPDRSSSTFADIQKAGHFCVNLLSADQHDVCRAFSRPVADRFQNVSWEPSEVTGAPRILNSLGWIDCTIEEVHEAGDHFIVVGRVHALEREVETAPLLFFQGGFGTFSSLTLATQLAPKLGRQMYFADLGRQELDRLSALTGQMCTLLASDGEDTIVLGASDIGKAAGTFKPLRVGQRYPLVPPMGSLFVAWDEEESQKWIERVRPASADLKVLTELLDVVRQRGWTLGIHGPSYARFMEALNRMPVADPTEEQLHAVRAAAEVLEIDQREAQDALQSDEQLDVRSISAPIFGSDGKVELLVSVVPMERCSSEAARFILGEVQATAERITKIIAESSEG